MAIYAKATRTSARKLAKEIGGKVRDLQPQRKVLTLNGLSDKNAPVKKGLRWVVVKD